MNTVLLLLALLSHQFTAISAVSVHAADTAFEALARTVSANNKLTITNHKLEGDTTEVTLDLQRFEVWDHDATLYVDDKPWPRPTHAYFKGSIVGEPESSVMLSVRSDGGSNGMVFRPGGRSWAVGSPKSVNGQQPQQQGGLRSKKAAMDKYSGKTPTCHYHDLDDQIEHHFDHDHSAVSLGRKMLANYSPDSVINTTLVANIAVDTDWEFVKRVSTALNPTGTTTSSINNPQIIFDYIGDLIGYSDLTFSREVGMDMVAGYARVWSTSADPYSSTTSSTTAITNFKNYWNTNMQSVNRTVALLMSGMASGGGISYVGQGCGYYSSKTANSAYCYAGDMANTKTSPLFSWNGNQNSNPAALVYDIFTTQHELAHSFNAKHTQEMCNVPSTTYSQPVDRCAAGCLTATGTLPTCTSSTPWYHSGGGTGSATLMSYCYTLKNVGALATTSMTFGLNHPCGNNAWRIPNEMQIFVQSKAATYPYCFKKPVCGNGVCEVAETCSSCAADCGACTTTSSG